MEIVRPRYIKNAIFWNRYVGERGAWMRVSDLNLVRKNEDEYYLPALTGRVKFIIREAYPYEDWMEEYIGTEKPLKENN